MLCLLPFKHSVAANIIRALPPALLALCPEEKCNLCGIEFNGPSISQSHYHGKAHAKKVSAYLDAAENIPDGQKPKKVICHFEKNWEYSFIKGAEDGVRRAADGCCSQCQWSFLPHM